MSQNTTNNEYELQVQEQTKNDLQGKEELLDDLQTIEDNENEDENEERETVTIKGTILRVNKAKDSNRYFFELDCEPFRNYNEKEEEILTTTFGKDITSFAKEVGIKHEVLNAGFALSSAIPNSTLSPSFVSLCLTGCEVEVKRVLRHATDQRKGMTAADVYGKEVWTNEITDCIPHLTALSTQLLIKYLQDTDKLVVKQVVEEEKKPDYQALLAGLSE